jgi:hypothetical protein
LVKESNQIGENSPAVVNCYIELVPTDTVKYEIDKATGYLRIDRPQRFSNVCPTLYGLIPQTLCGDRVAARAGVRIDKADLKGDGDPMDICVFTERDIAHGDIILDAIPIGGLRFVDSGMATKRSSACSKAMVHTANGGISPTAPRRSWIASGTISLRIRAHPDRGTRMIAISPKYMDATRPMKLSDSARLTTRIYTGICAANFSVERVSLGKSDGGDYSCLVGWGRLTDPAKTIATMPSGGVICQYLDTCRRYF